MIDHETKEVLYAIRVFFKAYMSLNTALAKSCEGRGETLIIDQLREIWLGTGDDAFVALYLWASLQEPEVVARMTQIFEDMRK